MTRSQVIRSQVIRSQVINRSRVKNIPAASLTYSER